MSSNYLDPAELRSLRELTHGSLRQHISDVHAAKLLALGYARESPEGLAITMLGRAVLIANLSDWPAGQTSPPAATPPTGQPHPE
jgi:hypothetical protein